MIAPPRTRAMIRSMRLEFVKMHGLGNDFIVVDAGAGRPLPAPPQWRALADRHTGIGFDQALVLEPPHRADTACYYRIFNADGGEVSGAAMHGGPLGGARSWHGRARCR